MQPYSSPPDRLKNTLPHVGPTTSLRTVILRGDRGLAHTVAMIEVTCDVSLGSIRDWVEPVASPAMSAFAAKAEVYSEHWWHREGRCSAVVANAIELPERP